MTKAAQSFPVVRNSRGVLVSLGPELGRGGEGTVFSLSSDPTLAAKIYHGSIAREKVEKIIEMIALRTDVLASFTAWPEDVLRDSRNIACGFLMPKINGFKDIHGLYSPKSRRTEFVKADWRFLIRAARNVARVFAAIHETGCVIGDVNHGSVVVSPQATVKLIDCDSFQINTNGKSFFCDVGNPTFTPPELQSISLTGMQRTANHDAFGLAVLIFLLLFMGRHPYAGRYIGGEMPIEKAIKEFRFAYSRNQSNNGMQPPPYTLALDAASDEVASLFEAAFGPKGIEANGRPTPSQWNDALERLENKLKVCPHCSSHHFLNSLNACPWCPIEGTTGTTLFPLTFAGGTNSFVDMASLWARISTIGSLTAPPVLKQKSDFGAVTPSEEATNIGREGKRYKVTLAGAMLFAVLFGTAMAPALFFLFVWVGIVLHNTIQKKFRSVEANKIWQTYEDAKNRYNHFQQQWQQQEKQWSFEAANFRDQVSALLAIRKNWEELPNIRLRKLQELERNRHQLQLRSYLEKFYVEKADISGIGPSRKVSLQSFNVETAWDITFQNVTRVPGFGKAMAEKLISWRKNIEKTFVYSASQGTDPNAIQRVEQEVYMERHRIEKEVREKAEKLFQLKQQTAHKSAGMKHTLDQALEVFLQAEADWIAAK